jgi:hypothetical protein
MDAEWKKYPAHAREAGFGEHPDSASQPSGSKRGKTLPKNGFSRLSDGMFHIKLVMACSRFLAECDCCPRTLLARVAYLLQPLAFCKLGIQSRKLCPVPTTNRDIRRHQMGQFGPFEVFVGNKLDLTVST